MRTAQWLAAACVLGFAAGADAQFPQNSGQQFPQYPYLGGGPGMAPSVLPNFYNPQYQPLSPYLNLNRGGSPAVNYYYGVRPGTIGGAGTFGGAAALALGGARPPFFPQVTQTPDPVDLPGPGEGYALPPAGHPIVYNNTLGYYPVPFGMRGSGLRPGLMGAGGGGGASQPPRKR
jgi:hypothetical protein